MAPTTLAEAIRDGDDDAIREIAATVLVLRPDNLVKRPWSRRQLATIKGVATPERTRVGESFEVSADPTDSEARAHPSIVKLRDDSEIALSELLSLAGPQVLGERFVRGFGRRWPVLPKMLDIHELLSVQGHPVGLPEAYVVLEADPGATIRLGFRDGVDTDQLSNLLVEGRRTQEELLQLEAQDSANHAPRIVALRQTLDAIGAEALAALNEIPVERGDVIFNATPSDEGIRSAEVHALGNPERRGILMLEVRLPGPTLLAWDHARVPARPLHIEEAFRVMRLAPRNPRDFRVDIDPVAGRPGVCRSIACEAFVLHHLRPDLEQTVDDNGATLPHTLHAIDGRVRIESAAGDELAVLEQGRSALVPLGVGAYRIQAVDHASEVIQVSVPIPASVTQLDALRRTVDESRGPSDVIAVSNGGDADLVRDQLSTLRRSLFRADGTTTVFVHEEQQRRGQLLGLLDALRAHRAEHGRLDHERVAVGVMLPGQGARLSPLTQRLWGIKPFLPLLVRHERDGSWFNGATASLYTWTLVQSELERCGFRGVCWKWGDEPQLPANADAFVGLNLSDTDAVRFGARCLVTEDLSRNKEWLHADPHTGRLIEQVRRRPREQLMRKFGAEEARPSHTPLRAHVHIGSPALSHLFLEEAARVFGDLGGALDVDGYLFEALTQDERSWRAEAAADPGIVKLLESVPDFYERCRTLRASIEAKRGHPLVIRVVDFGEQLYWADIGQLDRARQTFVAALADDRHGQFARALACIDHLERDAHGNFVGDGASISRGDVRNSLVLGSTVADVTANRAVIVGSTLARGRVEAGSVVLDSRLRDFTIGSGAFSFRSIADGLQVAGARAHTSIPRDPANLAAGLEDWQADLGDDLSKHWDAPAFGNPLSFAAKSAQMRARDVDPRAVEQRLRTIKP
ncbi:MAG: hypothetical protein CMJ85_11125 [Planctomycetes bacterium]|nr:hypothetical protein [Planctomycetota bacterium]